MRVTGGTARAPNVRNGACAHTGEDDPTSRILLGHYRAHFPEDGGTAALANVIINIALLLERRRSDAAHCSRSRRSHITAITEHEHSPIAAPKHAKVFYRNTMSKEVVKLVEKGGAPWLTIENGHLTEESKRQADEMYLKLGGRVFFQNVEPMRAGASVLAAAGRSS